MNLLKQNYVKYGLVMCVVLLACLMIMEITRQNESFDGKYPIQFFFMMIAPAIVWFWGIYAKKKMNKNKLTFKQGLNEGFRISLVYAIISPFIFLAYYTFVNPQIVNSVKEMYKMSGEPNSTVIAVDMTVQFISAIIFGTIYGAIISLFLKFKS